MSNVTFGGLASGIQWQDLIDEMMRLERRPVDRLQSQVKTLETRSSAWGTMRGYIQQLETAAKSLAGGDAFARYNVAVRGLPAGKTAPFSASASGEAMPGSYQVTVHQLAAAEKLGGDIVPSRTDALGYEGEFLINGRRIAVEAGDSLEKVAASINAANTGSNRSGVSATILKIDDGAYRMVLTSEKTGAAGMELVDGANGVLRELGILSGGTALKHGTADGAQSDAFKSASSPIAEARGFSYPPPAGNLRLGPPGYSFAVMIDLAEDSLEEIARKINDAADPESGIAATVVTEGEGEAAVSRLEISGTTDLQDDGGVLEALGVLTGGKARTIVAGADARVEIDGEMITRAENTISDVVSGVTFRLTNADPELTAEAAVTRNNSAAADQINALVKSYNDLVGFIEAMSQGSGSSTGAAIGKDGLVRQMRAQLRDALQAQLPDDGEGGLRRLGEIGIEIDRNGRFVVDSTKLNDALAADAEGVQRLFGLRETIPAAGEGDGGEEGGAGGVEVRGIAVALQEIAKSLLGSEAGSIQSITDRIGEQIGGTNRRIGQMEARLERKHEQLLRQYAALEQLLSYSQSQMGWPSAQIGALNGLGQPR
jgi:flagellar hook-associated protein 2